MRCLLFNSVGSVLRILEFIVVNLFLRKDVSQLVFEHLGVVLMTVSVLSLELMQRILYSPLVELNHSRHVSVESERRIAKRIVFCQLHARIFDS